MRQVYLYEHECPNCGWIDYRAEKTVFEECVNCLSKKPRKIRIVSKEMAGSAQGNGKPTNVYNYKKEWEEDRIKEALKYTQSHFSPRRDPPPPPKPKAPPKPKTPYELLEIKIGATLDEIKKSFRRLALQYHPDLHDGDKEMEEQFKLIANAYSKLVGK